MTKSALRQTILRERAMIDLEAKKHKDQAIFERLTALNIFKEARTISCFVSDPERFEIDTTAILDKILSNSKSLYVPVMRQKGSMQMAKINSLHELSPNKWGILEPKKPVYSIQQPELVIVPMLASDQRKQRLGFGMGYYDRYLQANASALRVGLVYESFIFKQLPSEDHDIPMHIIITDENTY
jgi:5-formyltetrahydrofolate cyclo-ligase